MVPGVIWMCKHVPIFEIKSFVPLLCEKYGTKINIGRSVRKPSQTEPRNLKRRDNIPINDIL